MKQDGIYRKAALGGLGSCQALWRRRARFHDDARARALEPPRPGAAEHSVRPADGLSARRPETAIARSPAARAALAIPRPATMQLFRHRPKPWARASGPAEAPDDELSRPA